MKRCIVFLLLIGFYLPSKAQLDDCANTELDKFRVLFLLDASYSMEKKWGEESLWELAKKTVSEFAYYLQKNYNVEMGLRVYGHNSPISMNDCEDSKLEVPIQENAALLISNRLKKIQYKGTTPLTYSLEKAADDLGCNSKQNIIILITDGYETCNRNPCATALKLLNYRIAIKPLVIGLNIDYKDIEHLKCIGEFKNVTNKKEFKQSLFQSFVDIASKKSLSLFLKNGNNPISETRVAYTIFDSKTGKNISSAFHTLAPNNLPDSFVIGDFDTINVRLHTIPPTEVYNIALDDYKHNNIVIPYPKSTITTKWNQTILQKTISPPEVMIYQNQKLLERVPYGSDIDIVSGNYDILINSIPIKTYKNQNLTPSNPKTISLDAPGYLHINKGAKIYADLYYYEGNKIIKCYTLSPEISLDKLAILPGKYKVIYRSIKSFSIHGTFEKEFVIKPNDVVNLQL